MPANIYDGLTQAELDEALLLCARQQIETEPNYTYVAARLLMARIRSEVTAVVGGQVGHPHEAMVAAYPARFRA
ncbi:hypothetical protein [Salinisphaera sp. LB1]|uniref:hypothetical protein n=1 Tax=Salinisphaera sp. LB1 TaxID=2183911 RepID=UPI000D705885|nr:hypothetical protein [Salinisphaera sp. LB1]AWN17903.1 Ribonucleotide reductase of class Ia (aerobic), alpha subunit [Salinisphaera sp. LB1]